MNPAALPARAVRFGAFEVDLRSGELRRQGVKIKLQEQPFQVLVMLLEHPGEVVTREELRKRLWPEDTFVDFDHSLSTAINKIREALSDSAEGPRFVETVPRRGYRFIAPVAPASSPATSEPEPYERRAAVGTPPLQTAGAAMEPVAPPITTGGFTRRAVTAMAQGILDEHRARLRWRRLAGLGLSLAGLAVALVLLIGLNAAGLRDRILRRTAPAQSALPSMRVVPFTTFPGHERGARFSPDGNQIAFAWDGENEDNWDIYVKQIGEEKPLRLTSDPGEDSWPVWSPDGQYIAFSRHGEREDGIYIVPALGGPERKLHPAKFRGGNIDWSPDGKYLAYVDSRPEQQGASIFLLEVDNPDNTRALTSPSGPLTIDWFPRFSPDGQTLAFIRLPTRGSARDIHLVRVTGGNPRRLTFDNVAMWGLDWGPNGASVIFSSARLGLPRLWKVAAAGGEPEPLALGQGDAYWPSLSRGGRRLAYTQSFLDANIWRYELPGAAGRNERPTKLVASTQMDQGQQFSPDGRRIVFGSDRSGSSEIWICDSDGTAPLQLTFFGGPMAGTPRWSPDGRQIAFDAEPEGHGDIYVVSADGGRPRRLTTDTSNDVVPSWSRDGRSIYFASDRTGGWQVWKMPAEGGRAVQVTKQGGFAAFESSNGKTLYYAKGQDQPGLWSVPVEGGEETPVLEQLGAGYWGHWSLRPEGIYFYNASTKAIEFFSFGTHKVTRVVKPEKRPNRNNPGFTISPDGRRILFAQIDQDIADIMLVENFRW